MKIIYSVLLSLMYVNEAFLRIPFPDIDSLYEYGAP
jgi:hypothetical protein